MGRGQAASLLGGCCFLSACCKTKVEDFRFAKFSRAAMFCVSLSVCTSKPGCTFYQLSIGPGRKKSVFAESQILRQCDDQGSYGCSLLYDSYMASSVGGSLECVKTYFSHSVHPRMCMWMQ